MRTIVPTVTTALLFACGLATSSCSQDVMTAHLAVTSELDAPPAVPVSALVPTEHAPAAVVAAQPKPLAPDAAVATQQEAEEQQQEALEAAPKPVDQPAVAQQGAEEESPKPQQQEADDGGNTSNLRGSPAADNNNQPTPTNPPKPDSEAMNAPPMQQPQQQEVVQEAKEGPNGLKLKMLINCFAWYLQDAAYRPDNSKVQGCDESKILICRTDSGHGDHFCKFDGSNHLQDAWEIQTADCYYNCQMETCNAWGNPTTDATKKCVADLYQP